MQYNKKPIDKVNSKIEESIGAEEFSEDASGDPGDLDSEASSPPGVPVSSSIDDGNTHKTNEYLMTIDIDVKNINKYDKNAGRKIYEAIYELYFGKVRLFPKYFLYYCLKKN